MFIICFQFLNLVSLTIGFDNVCSIDYDLINGCISRLFIRFSNYLFRTWRSRGCFQKGSIRHFSAYPVSKPTQYFAVNHEYFAIFCRPFYSVHFIFLNLRRERMPPFHVGQILVTLYCPHPFVRWAINSQQIYGKYRAHYRGLSGGLYMWPSLSLAMFSPTWSNKRIFLGVLPVKLMQNMPRVVENQKVKFDTDVLLKQLQVDSEVGGKSNTYNSTLSWP